MADLALGGLKRIVGACLAIKDAVETVQQNKKECRDIQRCVDRNAALLSWLKELTMGAMVHHPSFTGPLDDLAESMEEALELITDCQQRSALRHLLGAGEYMAKRLRWVKEDIQRKLATVILATSILNLHISVSVTNTLQYVGAHPPLLLLQPQVAGEVNSYGSNLSAIEMRPGVNSNTTMVATGNVVPYASSSRLTEINSPMWESALHLSSEENISEGGHAFVLKQRIVIKMGAASSRSRAKAMALVARAAGVVSLAITGDGKDQMEVSGEGVDSAMLIRMLRKKIGAADLMMEISADPSHSNGELPDRTAPSWGSSPDSEESESPLSLPRPALFKGKGKQTDPAGRSATHHQEVRPPPVAVAAAPAQPDGPTPKGIMAHLRAAAAGLKASRLSALHEWLVASTMPAYGIIFVLLFLLFLRMVISSNS